MPACETRAMAIRAGHRHSDQTRMSSLPALRWVAEEDLVYEPETNTLHRPECPRVGDLQAARSLPARSSLELTWAPALCECRPDVTLGLGAGASAG